MCTLTHILRCFCLFAFLPWIGIDSLGAQSVDPSTAEAVHAPDSTYRTRNLVLPALGTSPETGFLFGGVYMRQFKPGGASPDTRSSSFLFSAIYTLKKQLMISFYPEWVSPAEGWMLSGENFVNYFPEDYWGIGPYTRSPERVSVTYTQVNLDETLLRRLGRNLYAGLDIRYSRLQGIRLKDGEGNRLPSEMLPGAGGSVSSGVGWVLRLDRRNSLMTPTRGMMAEISNLFYPAFLGSTDPYLGFTLDLRRYWRLKRKATSILAVQLRGRLTEGHPSFRDLALLGGENVMRGYYTGRYRDHNALQTEAEWRKKLGGRFGFTLFAGTGEVWRRFEDFSMRNYKWSAGLGLRYDFNPEDPTNIRFDYGFTKESTGLYITFGEAF